MGHELRFCHEAQDRCEVAAPTLLPVKGDRVKTDRRDALKLARNYRAGELTTVWLSDAAHQALRDALRRVPVYLNRQLSRRTCPR